MFHLTRALRRTALPSFPSAPLSLRLASTTTTTTNTTTTASSTSTAPSPSRTPARPPRKTAPLVRISGGFKTYKPITPSIRHLRQPVHPHLWRGKPFRLLTLSKRKTGGRNSTGRIVSRHIGGGHKRRLRTVDFHRFEGGVRDVVRIEYDPGRSAHIALLRKRNDADPGATWSYIIAPAGLRAGDTVESFRTLDDAGVRRLTQSKEFVERFGGSLSAESSADDEAASKTTAGPSSLDLGLLRMHTVRPGNVLPLRLIPVGTIIHALSLKPKGPARLLRAAGSFGQLISHSSGPGGKYAQVRLQSGEVRYVLMGCSATVGTVSNEQHHLRSLGKAGRSRWLGRRPHVRGVAMNAKDHPHGGGRGKSKGNKHPRSIWGWLTKGKRTRKPKIGNAGHKHGNTLVVRERTRGKTTRKA